MAVSKSRKLNLIPVFGDLATLVIGLFILIIVVQISKLENITHADEIPIGLDFGRGKYDVPPEQRKTLNTIFREKYLEKIKTANSNSTLVSIRIEGHTDPDRVTIKKGGFATNNKQLSYLRAEKVADIFEEMIKDSFTNQDQKSILKKINIIGHGSKYQKYGFKERNKYDETDNAWVVYQKVDNDQDSIIVKFEKYDGEISPEKQAENEFKKRLRRVEIVLVVKGIPED